MIRRFNNWRSFFFLLAFQSPMGKKFPWNFLLFCSARSHLCWMNITQVSWNICSFSKPFNKDFRLNFKSQSLPTHDQIQTTYLRIFITFFHSKPFGWLEMQLTMGKYPVSSQFISKLFIAPTTLPYLMHT